MDKMEQDLKDSIMKKIKTIHEKVGKTISKQIDTAREQVGQKKPQEIIQKLTDDLSDYEKKLTIKQQRIERLNKIREQAKQLKKVQNGFQQQQQETKQKSQVTLKPTSRPPLQQKVVNKPAKVVKQQEEEQIEEESMLSQTKEIEQQQQEENSGQQGEEEKENKKPVNKFKDRWNSQCKIIIISVPTKIVNQPQIKNKKYQIRFTYLTEDGKQREATVRFGSTKGGDYVDNQDQGIRELMYKKYGGLVNPLDGNYWRYWICNTEPDENDKTKSVIDNTNEIIKLVGEAQEQLISHKLIKSGNVSIQQQKSDIPDQGQTNKPIIGLQTVLQELKKKNSQEVKQ